MNLDCYETCREKEETHFLCPKTSSSGSKSQWMLDNCPRYEEKCINPDPILIQHFELNDQLWRCSKNSSQYIHISQVCNKKFDCFLNEDESDSVCKHFPLTMALVYRLPKK